ncbi:MAG: LysM peptidoglycan-binding domain-containing protein [Cyclobacteriaceae bacterium]
MMLVRKSALLVCIILIVISVAGAQSSETRSSGTHSPKVPENISFADMRLELTADARKKVQTDVDALTRYEKYFNAKVDRVDAYFPLIEEVLREENVPEDIKYLVIQESALVGDAISSSNAVGYWQFKVPSATEVGLTINSVVDERMNIIMATRGAARYFKNNNAFFDNWLHALMAYYEGPGGALKKADKRFNGRKVMRLDGRAHWYILKYLSHKIAFEGAIGKNPNPPVQLSVYEYGGGQTLREIATKFSVTEEDLEPYNRWLKQKRVPEDKTYPVIIPDFSGRSRQPPIAENTQPENQTAPKNTKDPTSSVLEGEVLNSAAFPAIGTRQWFGQKQLRVNGVSGIIAQEGEDVKQLARRAGIPPSRLIKYNDLTHRQAEIVPGQPYNIRPKRNRAPARYHVAEPGETWWDVSQRFGIKLKKLLRNNRLKEEKPLEANRVLWLRYIRPATIPVEYRKPMQQPTNQPSVASAQTATIATSASAEVDEGTVDTSASERAWRNLPSEETNDRSQKKIDLGQDDLKDVSYHTVAAQETLYSIAKKYGLSAAELAGYNKISVYESLQVEQQLRIPNSETATSIPVGYHEVRAGETMYQIAQEYSISLRELMEWNEKENFTLKVGERLRVASPN